MTHPVVKVTMDDTLSHVKNLFDQQGFHHLLVVEQHKIVGVISDRDLLKSISPNLGKASQTDKDMASLNKRVHQIMTRDLVVIDHNQTLFKAIQLFNRNSISCLPVVDSSNKPVGIISWRDIFKHLEISLIKKSHQHQI